MADVTSAPAASTTTSTLSDWAGPYVTGMLGKAQALGGGNGLGNMRQRVEELGGSFWQGDAEAGGLCLEMALPRGLR